MTLDVVCDSFKSKFSRPKRCIVCLATLLLLPGCTRTGGSLPEAPTPEALSNQLDDAPQSHATQTESRDARVAETKTHAFPGQVATLVEQLDRLRRRAAFAQFVELALQTTHEIAQPPSAAEEYARAEALLAIGQHEAAEGAALQGAELARQGDSSSTVGQGLRLWAVARMRQQKPLADARALQIASLAASDGHAAAADSDTIVNMVRFWQTALTTEAPYRCDVPSHTRIDIPRASGEWGELADDLVAIQAEANGVSMPLVFVDTGAQTSVMTVAAAKLAGVQMGAATTPLVGFRAASATPGVIATLRLGSLTLHNVPVLVGDSAPLVAQGGQMALGTELMHHVRFTIDYPRRQIWAEKAGQRTTGDGLNPPSGSTPHWEIPVWTFSQACLCAGMRPGGEGARVLLDTGNRAGTFVSPRWARSNVAHFRRPTGSLVFKFKPRNLFLDDLEIGGQALRQWPVLDILPADLERLDLVDVLVGHDLLAPYQLTIDLQRRVFELRGNPPTPAPARPKTLALETTREN